MAIIILLNLCLDVGVVKPSCALLLLVDYHGPDGLHMQVSAKEGISRVENLRFLFRNQCAYYVTADVSQQFCMFVDNLL
jgi:hypothetical protein